MRVVVINHLSLDGVMQAPGAPDEDTRHEFRHGGWATQRSGPELGEAMRERMGDGFAWLFGRRSYDGMLSAWNDRGGPFKAGLNRTTKYVASSDPSTDLRWPSSTLLTGDVVGEVAHLRESAAGNLVVMGSGQLVRSLLPHGLVDEMLLFVHPVVLGSGERLFGTDQRHDLELVTQTVTQSGVLVVTYAPSGG